MKKEDVKQIARAAIGMVNVLWGLVSLMVLIGLLASSTGAWSIAVFATLIVAAASQLAAGIGLVISSKWAMRALLMALLVQAAASAFVAFRVEWAAAFILPAVALLSAVLLHFAGLGVSVDPGEESESGSRTKRAILIAAGLVAAFFVFQEAEFVADEFKLRHLQSKCEEGDLRACRSANAKKMQRAKSFEEMKEAAARFDELCREGSVSACRSVGYIRSDYFGSHRLRDALDVILGEVRTRASEQCAARDPRSCIVWASFAPSERQEELTAISKELCEAGDRHGCMAWGLTLRRTESKPPAKLLEDPDRSAGFCAAGFEHACPAPTDALERCAHGDLASCSGAAAQADDPDDAALLTALAAAKYDAGNPGLYGVKLPKADHEARCADGSALGCLAAGLELVTPFWSPHTDPPPLPPAAELDETFGKACEMGLPIACIAYGFRLLDRPLDEKRDFTTANAQLQKACDADVAAACRLRSYETQMLEHDYAGHLAAAQEACMLGDRNACQSYANVLAYDIGSTPFPISDDVATVHLRRACAQSNTAMACANVAYMYRGKPITPDYRTAAFDAATTSCKSGYEDGCIQVFWAAKEWWPHFEEKLREQICPQVPRACRE